MKQKILELLNGMNSDSKSASFKCERELCKILTSIMDKKYKVESYADRYIQDYPDRITDVTSYGVYTTLPESIWCNDEEFKFETRWLDIDWESYFEELKQSSIKSIKRTIETKYDIGQEVWVEWFTIPTKMIIEALLFVKDSEIEKIMYSITNPDDRREFFDAEESELFPTKEELLKSL